MQPNLFPFGSVLGNPFLFNGGDLSEGGFESSRVFFLLPLLLSQGEGMDLSKVGEKFLSSVKSATSLGLLPSSSSSSSDRPEVLSLSLFLIPINVINIVVYPMCRFRHVLLLQLLLLVLWLDFLLIRG